MNILCADPGGLYVQQCNSLWKKGDIIKYWTSWQADQKWDWYSIGLNYGHLDKVKYLAEWYSWADAYFFPDVTGQDELVFLKSIYPKKSCFGSALAHKLEQDRWGLKKILKDIDIRFARSERIFGIDELRNYFIKNKDKFIKLSTFRGDVESFYAKDGESIDLKLDEIAQARGPFKNKVEFIIEDAINSDVEIGADLIFSKDDYQKPFLYGYECGKKFYFCHVSEELPLLLKDVMEKLKPVLKKLDYRSCISTEIKCVDKNTSYFLDITCRLANPLCALFNTYITNWREAVIKTGLGEKVRLNFKHKYLGAMFLNSNHGLQHYIHIEVEDKDLDHIKFVVVGENDGKFYSIRGADKVAVIVAGGNTIQEVIDIIKKYADRVNADGLDKGAVHEIDKIHDIIASGKLLGISF